MVHVTYMIFIYLASGSHNSAHISYKYFVHVNWSSLSYTKWQTNDQFKYIFNQHLSTHKTVQWIADVGFHGNSCTMRLTVCLSAPHSHTAERNLLHFCKDAGQLAQLAIDSSLRPPCEQIFWIFVVCA